MTPVARPADPSTRRPPPNARRVRPSFSRTPHIWRKQRAHSVGRGALGEEKSERNARAEDAAASVAAGKVAAPG